MSRPPRGGDVAAREGRGVVARPVAQFAVIGLAAVLIVGLATAAASRRVGQREAISDARTTTVIKAQGLVEPVVTDGLINADPEAVAVVAAVVETQVLDESLVRVKIWTADGRIVYSDARELEGTTYTLGADDLAALRSGLIEAEVSDLSQPENRFERQFGKLLEVYLPIRTPSGERLLFEAYFRYDAVSESGQRIWRSFAPICIGALIVLELLQIPLAWSLASRLRHRQRERESLLRHAVEASEVERRRIASDLHDGVVQDLVGVSFQLAGAARKRGISPGTAILLGDASESVRSNITALRSMLLDIYPADLVEVGLWGALEDLASEGSTNDLVVTVDATELPASPPEAVAKMLYRAAREALRNVTLHARATTATIRAGNGVGTAWVSVTDNGVGFEPQLAEERAAEGHFGLRGLQGVIRDAGGTLRIESEPGAGTTVFVEMSTR